MSTTQANLPVASSEEGTPPTASVGYGRPAAAGGDRLSRWWLLTPVAVIAVCLGAWGSYRSFFRPTMDGNISLYTVKRTSFPIMLKEKGELKAHKSVDIKCEIEGGSTIIWIVPEGTTVLGQPAVPINECKRQMAVIQQLPDLKKRIKSLEQELARLKDQLT